MATILVVDDDSATVEFLVLVLKEAGYHVLAVGGGLPALRVLRIIRVQLVLADVKMPGMDGRTLCRTLAADPTYQAIPRVLMSIWWDAGDDLPCVTAFLRKPFMPSVLLHTVQQAVQAQPAQCQEHP